MYRKEVLEGKSRIQERLIISVQLGKAYDETIGYIHTMKSGEKNYK